MLISYNLSFKRKLKSFSFVMLQFVCQDSIVSCATDLYLKKFNFILFQ